MPYKLNGRGQTYNISNKGEFEVNSKYSSTWRIYGIASRWNGRPVLWSTIKSQADKGKTIIGYLHDIDHGTRRMWGGSWNGKLPKVRLWKV